MIYTSTIIIAQILKDKDQLGKRMLYLKCFASVCELKDDYLDYNKCINPSFSYGLKRRKK
jgi:hypothetical protein